MKCLRMEHLSIIMWRRRSESAYVIVSEIGEISVKYNVRRRWLAFITCMASLCWQGWQGELGGYYITIHGQTLCDECALDDAAWLITEI